jgi:hypothetical protein
VPDIALQQVGDGELAALVLALADLGEQPGAELDRLPGRVGGAGLAALAAGDGVDARESCV